MTTPTPKQIEDARKAVFGCFDPDYVSQGDAGLNVLLNAIASLQAEVAAQKKQICEMDCGIGEDYYTNRVSLSKLSGVPAMAIVYREHLKLVEQKIDRLKAEVERKDKALAQALPYLWEAARESTGAGYAAISATESLAPLPKPPAAPEPQVCETCGGTRRVQRPDSDYENLPKIDMASHEMSDLINCPTCNGKEVK